MNKKMDRRVVRTKIAIKEAFFELLEETQDMKKISVKNIVDQANYNRATFYVHYQDKQALIAEVVNDAINGFLEAFREPYQLRSTLNLHQISINTIKIYEYIEKNRKKFTFLFNPNFFPHFQDIFSSCIENVFIKELVYNDPTFYTIDQKLYTRSQSYSMVGMIKYWIENDYKWSASYMTEQTLAISKFDPTSININTKNN